jgi:hypothetical protein
MSQFIEQYVLRGGMLIETSQLFVYLCIARAWPDRRNAKAILLLLILLTLPALLSTVSLAFRNVRYDLLTFGLTHIAWRHFTLFN